MWASGVDKGDFRDEMDRLGLISADFFLYIAKLPGVFTAGTFQLTGFCFYDNLLPAAFYIYGHYQLE